MNIQFPSEHYARFSGSNPISKVIHKAVNRTAWSDHTMLFDTGTWVEILQSFAQEKNIDPAEMKSSKTEFHEWIPLIAWGYTKGVYNFNNALLTELCNSGLDEIDDCTGIFQYLPEQCMYFEGLHMWPESMGAQGTWVMYDETTKTLRFAVNSNDGIKSLQVPLINNSFNETIIAARSINGHSTPLDAIMFADQIRLTLMSLVYLCSANADIRHRKGKNKQCSDAPVKAKRVLKNGVWKLDPAASMNFWEVGYVIASDIIANTVWAGSHWVKNNDDSLTWLFGADSHQTHYNDDEIECIGTIDLTSAPAMSRETRQRAEARLLSHMQGNKRQ